MAEIVCSRCGHPNSAVSNFCSSCGFDLSRTGEEVTGEHPAVSTTAREAEFSLDGNDTMSLPDAATEATAGAAATASPVADGSADADGKAQAGSVADMEEASTTETTAVAGELVDGDVLFVVKRGPKAGSRFFMDKPTISLGRHPDSDIFLDDITVSRRHAEVSLDDGVFKVADVGSLNGTYLNRERIDSARLTSGDEVQVGKFKLVFLTGETR